ncbi:MAG: DUF2065 domain-containing protein [Cucumibacter sp.]
MSDFLAALGLAIALEGLVYAAFPEQMKRAIGAVLGSPNGQIRVIGLFAAGIGLIVLYWVRSQAQ